MTRRSLKSPNMKPPLNAASLWKAGQLGAEARVAIVDAGFDSSVRTGIPPDHFLDLTAASGAALDQTPNHHGTTVLGIIRRHAPLAQIWGAKVGTSIDGLNSSRVLHALDWCYRQGAQIVNLSMGFPVTSACLHNQCHLCDAIAKLAERGVLIVVAEGNDDPRLGSGGHLIRCPAVSEHAITVGAVDGTGTALATYSVRGISGRDKPDILAPGTALLADGTLQTGTSFAAPAVSAAIALLGPRIGYSAAWQIIRDTSRQHPISGSSAGVLDITKAWEVANGAGTRSGS